MDLPFMYFVKLTACIVMVACVKDAMSDSVVCFECVSGRLWNRKSNTT